MGRDDKKKENNVPLLLWHLEKCFLIDSFSGQAYRHKLHTIPKVIRMPWNGATGSGLLCMSVGGET
jgi:hypothetical protein